MNEKTYRFYGWETADVSPLTDEYPAIRTPRDMYDALLDCWCAETCAPRMRGDWSKDNPTLGQCSITSFLVQDLFGGRVYGIPLEEGGVHCFNEAGGRVFDLASEQFGERTLCYENTPEQCREEHLKDPDKKARYELLKKLFTERAGKR